MEDLSAFTHLIHGKGFSEAIAAGVEDWEILLDRREQPAFDDAWGSVFQTLHIMSYQNPMAEAEVTSLREFAFKAMLQLTQDAEVAAYVSDDIGLIADALAKALMSTYCDQLLASYKAGRFPC
ncbi:MULTISPECIES: hypothetical protein [Pseudomonas]|uniref:hypothetical protein n=1 Tax=Pseudomonas TaxID=286 RepID=UPI0021888F7A|nr:hypothetical protein [Pseudomonas sp. LRP2-20]BDM22770.1 hypothetical protein KMS_R25270 [Pseudomonas sp. LRP2-20]